MLNAQRALFHVGTGVRTALTARRLRKTGLPSAEKAQNDAFRRLVASQAKTVYGRHIHLLPEIDYPNFRARVPLQTREVLIPLVQRMIDGEPDVLWPGHCSLFAQTTGTTSGEPALLPVTDEWLHHYRQSSREALLYYTARTGHTGVLRGKQLFLGAPTVLRPLALDAKRPIFAGSLHAIAALNLPGWFEKHMTLPGAAAAQTEDLDARLRMIIDETLSEDISMISGSPDAVLTLFYRLRERVSRGKVSVKQISAVWPNLECITHGGGEIEPHLDEIRAWIGPAVNLHEVYASAEGYIAAQDRGSGEGLRVLTESGLFFEFIPLASVPTDSIPLAGAQALPLRQVVTGVDYALVMTTPAGLCRYLTGDIVQFVSVDPHRLLFRGRVDFRGEGTAERVADRDLGLAIAGVCKKHGWFPHHFHVAPLVLEQTPLRKRLCYEWWIELRAPCHETPISEVIAREIDDILSKLSSGYQRGRASGQFDAPIIRLVAPGVFEHWLKARGKWDSQQPMPRTSIDRQIADELAVHAGFQRAF